MVCSEFALWTITAPTLPSGSGKRTMRSGGVLHPASKASVTQAMTVAAVDADG
jgi:hypothetical protein